MAQSLRMTAMRWEGWGDPARAISLPPQLRALLDNALGVRPTGRPAGPLDAIELPPPAFDPSGLRTIVGEPNVRTGSADRIRHTRGKSTVDILRIRAGSVEDAPDVVVLPAGHEEVLEVLRWCAQRRIAVVPFGGGTSVVGGLAPVRAGFAGVVALDLARLDRLVALDPVSRTATLQAGVRAPVAEELLAAQGFTLGHFPQSFEYASIGGFAATRSSGQYSARYGRFDELVVGLRVATPQGSVGLGRAPRSGAGPDLRQLFLGSEGTLGVITEVTARVHPAPAGYTHAGWRFASFPDGMGALRRLAQDGPLPAMVRLADEYETALTAPGIDGCLAVVAFEASPVPAVEAVLRAAGGTPLGAEPGEAWARGRFQAPYLRDALLDAGALAETVETATFWSGLPALYDAVRACLMDNLGTPPLVLCHVSHVYPTGASLYFTVVCAQSGDPVSQWRQAKQAVNAAILAAGGTISHHHGVGTDHAAGLAEEVGPLMVDALRAVKRRLDPAGILNPGILLGTTVGP